jgi:hypothetical protein
MKLWVYGFRTLKCLVPLGRAVGLGATSEWDAPPQRLRACSELQPHTIRMMVCQ